MSEKKQKNIVDEIREIREKQAITSIEKDYEYLKDKDPALYRKLIKEFSQDNTKYKAA